MHETLIAPLDPQQIRRKLAQLSFARKEASQEFQANTKELEKLARVTMNGIFSSNTPTKLLNCNGKTVELSRWILHHGLFKLTRNTASSRVALVVGLEPIPAF